MMILSFWQTLPRGVSLVHVLKILQFMIWDSTILTFLNQPLLEHVLIATIQQQQIQVVEQLKYKI
jgi:hypothetical protein